MFYNEYIFGAHPFTFPFQEVLHNVMDYKKKIVEIVNNCNDLEKLYLLYRVAIRLLG